MYPMKSKRIRSGKTLRTILTHKHGEAESSCEFLDIDNLDTKSIEEAEDNFEEVFVRVRDLLKGKPWCCDNREDVLSICQAVTDELRSNLLIRKEEK